MSPNTQAASATRSSGLLSVQALRGFAVIGVILMHVPLYLANKLQVPDVLPQFMIGAAGVDVFFVISGFVMVYASERLFARPGATRTFLLRRAARIVPMYWIASTILLANILLRFPSLSAATGGSSWDYVVTSYLFFPSVRADGSDMPLLAVGWTLFYEAFFYLVFGLLIFLPRQRASWRSAASCALSSCSGCWSNCPTRSPTGANPIILEFVCGMGLAVAYRDGLRLPSWASYGLLAAGLAALAWAWAYPPSWAWRFPPGDCRAWPSLRH